MGLLTQAPVQKEQVARAMRGGAVSAILGVIAFAFIPVAVAQESWKPELRLQLEKEHGCELKFFTNVVVRNVNGRLLVKVRAHCMDGRAFDAERNDIFKLFKVRPLNTHAEAHYAPGPAGTAVTPERRVGMDVLVVDRQQDPT